MAGEGEKKASNKTDREHMHSVRDRLYDRSFTPRQNQRTELSETDSAEKAPHAWGNDPLYPTSGTASMDVDMATKKKKKYRFVLLVFGLFFFIAATALASVYMLLGGNTISNENISVAITGPSSIGGGEVLTLQMGVSNQNTVPLHSAILNIRFPAGTMSVDEESKELQRESIPLDTIQPGETLNIPVKAQMFGEEDEEKQIHAEIEYRLQGSNGTFEEEAESHLVRINSSPVTLSIEGVEQVSSGQPLDVTLLVRSNSTAVLRDIVVRAEYPFGFDFADSDPLPVSGQNVWMIDMIEPGETKEINLTGVVTGIPSEERNISASVGVSNNIGGYELASVFSTNKFQYKMEESFADLLIAINNSRSETVVLDEGQKAKVALEFENPMEDTLYDVVVMAELSGTALDESAVRVNDGFYDSIKNAVIFDFNTNDSLEQVLPGKKVRMSFEVTPDMTVHQTPEVNILFGVDARRVQHSGVSETLVGNELRTIRLASQVNLLSSVTYQSGVLPPVAEKLTQYTVSFRIEGGSNDLIDGEVTASLPSSVSWLDLSSGDGTVSFDPVSRTVLWNAGDISSNSDATVSFTVGFLPSISQVDQTPTLLSSQNFKATDRFTGTVVRDTVPALTTRLSPEAGYDKDAGVVLRVEKTE